MSSWYLSFELGTGGFRFFQQQREPLAAEARFLPALLTSLQQEDLHVQHPKPQQVLSFCPWGHQLGISSQKRLDMWTVLYPERFIIMLFFFFQSHRDVTDQNHCVSLRCTTSQFDLHTSGNDKFNEHPSSHIDTKLKETE